MIVGRESIPLTGWKSLYSVVDVDSNMILKSPPSQSGTAANLPCLGKVEWGEMFLSKSVIILSSHDIALVLLWSLLKDIPHGITLWSSCVLVCPSGRCSTGYVTQWWTTTTTTITATRAAHSTGGRLGEASEVRALDYLYCEQHTRHFSLLPVLLSLIEPPLQIVFP